MFRSSPADDIVVITGIGLLTALGNDRESTWQRIQKGESAIDWIHSVPWIPDGSLFAAQVPIHSTDSDNTRLKAIRFARHATLEAFRDAAIDWNQVDSAHMGCAISGHMGDSRGIGAPVETPSESANDPNPWWNQIFPNTACAEIAHEFKLGGPRISHSTACASGLISLLMAVRSIRDGQCDIAVAGGAEAIDPLFAAGFRNMRALADGDDPRRACQPFDINRTGFVLGEGGAIFVVERLSHALRRGATAYCSISPGVMLSEAHHISGLDIDADTLPHLMTQALEQSSLKPSDVTYINAHGTGTRQNDAAEISGINRVFRDSLDQVHVSATKSMLGHLIEAAGCVELAITILGLRDGIAPPTVGLNDLEPDCRFDCIARNSRDLRYQHALKLSLAFGGHLVGVIVSRWNQPGSSFEYPAIRRAA